MPRGGWRRGRASALLLLLAAGFAGVAGTATPAGAQAATRPPNIVLILADDLGYGDLGVYGQQTIRTPRLDRMAAEGMRFTQHYAGAPVCAPSRSVLMTGLHTGHTTVRGNFGAGNQRVPLAAEDVTVGEVLREAGYATAVIGKWGLGEPQTTGLPTRQGFDLFYGYLNQRHAHSHYPDYLWRGERQEPIPANADSAARVYSHDLFTAEALKFIEDQRERPFFLYLAYTLPHAEVRAPEVAMAPYADAHPPVEAAFAGMVSRLDRDVGRILDRLRELGLDRNTLVLFTSDNGAHAEGGHDAAHFDSSGPLRGIKRDLYEGGIRVPMIAWWPGQVAAGSRSDRPSAFWDFLATAADVAGTRAPRTDGISYLPTLRGEVQPAPERMYWEFYEGTPAQAVRMGEWKAIRRPFGSGPVELYDLQADPREQRDVAAAHPGVVARALAAFNESHRPSPFWPDASQ